MTVIAATNSQVGVEGTVNFVRPISGGKLEIKVVSGEKRWLFEVQDASGNSPILFSRVRTVFNVSSAVEQNPVRFNLLTLDNLDFLTGAKLPLAQNVAALRGLGSAVQHARCVAYLKGTVLGVSARRSALALQDETGVTLAELPSGGPLVAVGQQIILEGNCVVEGERVLFQNPPVVDNNDIHNMLEKSGTVFLSAGKHPLRLAWFNREPPYGLEVYFQGPGLPRQKIPDSALFRRGVGSPGSAPDWANGLDYGCYEGYWLRVPDFNRLVPARQGTAANFNTTNITRTDDVGLQFSGYFDAAREGIYTFFTVSDDGSLLFVDEEAPFIEILGTNALPQPGSIAVRQTLRMDQDDRWSEVDGTITFAAQQAGALELDLSSETSRMHVRVADDSGASPELLLNRRARVTGICLATQTADGQTVAGTLLVPGMAQVVLLGQPNESGSEPGAAVASNALPILHAVEQIKRLAREEWQHSYPVKIRGVITTVLDSGFFIQDSTASVYARWRAPTDYDAPRLGDLWEIEGATFAEFAPNIQVSRATRLGPGTMPEPLRPTWDQLINGSLDTEYVEVQGIITGVSSDHVTLLTRSGKISLELPDLQPQQLAQHQNALVRVRGCVMPVRDIKTQQVIPGQVRLANAAITADELPPANPFALRLKHVSDLLRFDLRAGAFQRVKIAGQLVHLRDGQLFLMDGSDGSRVIPTSMAGLQVGDMVEVVGFPDLGKPSPLLREAVVRRIGNARLPEPVLLPSPPPLNRRYDGTIVRVQALLAAVSSDHSDQLLELQSSSRSFFARLKTSAGSLPAISPGSLLELTGIYDGQGSDLALAPEINAFELLLNSPADVKVLARPSWWTVRHTLTLLGAMGMVILVGMVWIALLRRQVEERSNQLAVEIRRHEVSERQRELEAERARIARDLHDDLGATLTQIRFLSAVESRDSQLPETTRNRMGQVSEKSREMVTSLDEIVWAVNPANDSLPNLANYLCHFAEEFFRSTPIRCRLDVDEVLPMASLTSEVRHNLYLAVREALNNIAKHSQATEVWFRIHFQEPGRLCLTITDNGRGFSLNPDGLSGDGLANMRRRLMQIGGHFECENRAGGGVVCQFGLPVEIRSSLKS